MPELEAIIAVTLAGLALSVTPGPSMFYVLSRSVGQSRAAGLASALGLGLGGALLAVATALGLAVILRQNDWLFTSLSIAGSIYLLWLGYSMIRESRSAASVNFEFREIEGQRLRSIVAQGILVELLNPKTVLFFALFLPPFVGGGDLVLSQGDVQNQLLILGILVPLTALPADLVVAFLGGSMARMINRQQHARVYLSWLGGLILILIALNLHLNLL